MTNVLVTGADGQLSNCIEDLSHAYPELNFVYKTIDQLDITDPAQVKQAFSERSYAYCINCAAYTAVDKAESEQDLAFKVNAAGAAILSDQCQTSGSILVHISTDFVFDGQHEQPYVETDQTNPLGVYGNSKLQGEVEIRDILNEHYIIRTSWLYSEHGHNFMKTMLRLASERKELTIVDDQIGCPTYAGDLAEAIIEIISSGKQEFGTYHFSNSGKISWYNFAQAIFEKTNTEIKVSPIASINYKTAAQRPSYSVLNLVKFRSTFPEIKIKSWQESLDKALINFHMNSHLQTWDKHRPSPLQRGRTLTNFLC